eukprot:TRINITY_DN28668_c0_g2_i1.p1 TRINITY_DN28668_c0_g2~~TRINITY_DN28668_c0_g2_i1.p1  ORF type:complete len:221 (-),score=-29.48 TRINITY_DN28668_c0_g2_i1:134-775(-)
MYTFFSTKNKKNLCLQFISNTIVLIQFLIYFHSKKFVTLRSYITLYGIVTLYGDQVIQSLDSQFIVQLKIITKKKSSCPFLSESTQVYHNSSEHLKISTFAQLNQNQKFITVLQQYQGFIIILHQSQKFILKNKRVQICWHEKIDSKQLIFTYQNNTLKPKQYTKTVFAFVTNYFLSIKLIFKQNKLVKYNTIFVISGIVLFHKISDKYCQQF